jgi:predicted sulfurtransferase
MKAYVRTKENIRLKGLSSKICLAESGINRQVSLKERGAEIFS